MRPSAIAFAGVIAAAACASDLKLPSAPGPNEVAILVGAGDIAVCGAGGSMATGRLLDGQAGTVFVAGDIAYPDGTAEQFQNCYEPAWGRHKEIATRPRRVTTNTGRRGSAILRVLRRECRSSRRGIHVPEGHVAGVLAEQQQ